MPRPGRWMPSAKLRALFESGVSYDDIATINEHTEGWRPSISAISRKRDELKIPNRNVRHLDLVPWQIEPQHRNDRLRYMLLAESRHRANPTAKQSRSDKVLTDLLRDLLFGRGHFLVVAYSKDLGFVLTERKDSDTDIIRRPVNDDESLRQVIPDGTD